jgi:hypothetical protein
MEKLLRRKNWRFIEVKRKHELCILLFILLLSCLFSFDMPPISGKPSVYLKVSRVVWGEDPNSPIKAYPGDESMALTVEVQNYSNDTIKGVEAILMLSDPFLDIYGNHNVTATGEPSDIGDIMNQTGEILPAGFFTFTFSLDINSNALPTLYSYPLTVEYLVKNGTNWLEGETTTLTISFVVSKIQSTVTCSVSPQNVEKGEAVDVSGSINPVQRNATVTLAYKRPNGSVFVQNVKTDAEGSYRESYQPNNEGFWSVNASWAGDESHKGDWMSVSFEVRHSVSISIDTSNNRLTGGIDNHFNITLLNSGGILISTIDVALIIPAPLIIHGNNEWTFESLKSGNSTLIPVEIYAPESSIGGTYSGSLTMNYRDYYGETNSESYPIGLIVVGQITLTVYEKIASPQPAKPGSKISITATMLNKGNVAAKYVNASIIPNTVLDLTAESTAYVGEVEENSPAPFTLAANVKTNAPNGTCPITVSITYRDDQYTDQSFNATFYVLIEKNHEDQNISDGTSDLLKPFFDVSVILLTLVGASAVILFLYRRHLSSQPKTEDTSGKTQK